MFDKLKSSAGDAAIRKAIDKFAPTVNEKFAEITKLSCVDVKNDERFKKLVVTPALVMVSAASSGATSLIPNFDARFVVAMLHMRDELVVVDDTKNSVELAADYQKRLPDVLVAGFKKPV